ncbi:hypothetical protein DFH08DRAFT_1078334 [Mycena albidolilacea]|uniref:Uncharacterized protein n=1 Tax=Mycena albidolilacea TaxID=1033008 RepID=A0AAD7A816_9AGAR|nr:hypothetical protein DFH08DRAFT_1078334 [Mycena albidolilacea]
MPTGSTPRRYEHRSDPATSYTRSTRRWRSSPPTSPRRLPARCDSSAVYRCCHLRPPYSPAPPSLLPPHAMVVPHRRRRFCHLLPRQVRLQQVPLSPIHAQSACIHDPSRAQHLQQPLPIPRATVFASLPAATVSSASLSSAPSQLLSGTRSVTRSIARARNKCNERFPSPAPPSSPLRALRPSSAPTPPSAPNLGLPRIANATCTTPGVSLCGRPHRPVTSPLSTSVLSGVVPRSLPTPPHRGPCAARRTAASHRQRRLRDTHPALSLYPPSALRISDKRGWGTPTILGATNPGGDSRTTYAAPGFHFAPRPVQFGSPASAASSGKGTA